ncbi:MAG: alpha/beta fold hydrolase, partial [Usitatibacteraceae bacterium]
MKAMKRVRRCMSLAGSLILLAACAEQSTPDRRATLPLKACRVAHVDNEVKCGRLEVFENRQTGQGRKIALNIVVIPASARNKQPDPVFLFAGGPGQAAAELAREALMILGGLNTKRDLVLIDQRGTGKSNGLKCTLPDFSAPELADPATRDAATRKALATCRTELERKADLTQYTTTIAMADIDQVREELGYEQINLWGGSYGTRAAMEYLRRYESRVRTIVLDGVAPPSMALPEGFARDAAEVTEKMFVACSKEAECAKNYANVKSDMAEVIAALAKQPRSVRVADPVTGIVRETTVSREMLLGAVFPALYVPEMVAMLPTSLSKAKGGDFASLMAMSAVFTDSNGDKNAMGMRLSVVCAEDVPRIQRGNPSEQPPPFGSLFIDEFAKGCDNWPKGVMAKDFDQPVKSSKPVLIFSGGLDPVTPPPSGEEV